MKEKWGERRFKNIMNGKFTKQNKENFIKDGEKKKD